MCSCRVACCEREARWWARDWGVRSHPRASHVGGTPSSPSTSQVPKQTSWVMRSCLQCERHEPDERCSDGSQCLSFSKRRGHALYYAEYSGALQNASCNVAVGRKCRRKGIADADGVLPRSFGCPAHTLSTRFEPAGSFPPAGSQVLSDAMRAWVPHPGLQRRLTAGRLSRRGDAPSSSASSSSSLPSALLASPSESDASASDPDAWPSRPAPADPSKIALRRMRPPELSTTSPACGMP